MTVYFNGKTHILNNTIRFCKLNWFTMWQVNYLQIISMIKKKKCLQIDGQEEEMSTKTQSVWLQNQMIMGYILQVVLSKG